MAATTSPKKIGGGICYAFNREGGCAKGDACIFMHEIGEVPPPLSEEEVAAKRAERDASRAAAKEERKNRPKVEKVPKVAAAPAAKKAKKARAPRSNKPKSICYAFNREGGCDKGDACRFLHEIGEVPPPLSEEEVAAKRAERDASRAAAKEERKNRPKVEKVAAAPAKKSKPESAPVPPEFIGQTMTGFITDVLKTRQSGGQFGFIAIGAESEKTTGSRIYFNFEDFTDATFKPRRGYNVQFTVTTDEAARMAAKTVTLTASGKVTAAEREASLLERNGAAKA